MSCASDGTTKSAPIQTATDGQKTEEQKPNDKDKAAALRRLLEEGEGPCPFCDSGSMETSQEGLMCWEGCGSLINFCHKCDSRLPMLWLSCATNGDEDMLMATAHIDAKEAADMGRVRFIAPRISGGTANSTPFFSHDCDTLFLWQCQQCGHRTFTDCD